VKAYSESGHYSVFKFLIVMSPGAEANSWKKFRALN